MTNQNITEQLLRIVSSDDFANSSTELTEDWASKGIGVESVDPILEFMEAYPDLHYGMPGALVHFVEEFYQKGYEERLIKSINRKPTKLTIFMLNRVINGTYDPKTKEELISIMRQAAINPKSDRTTLERINGFLERLEA